ncbi:hypothetical protein Jolie1_055 [Mycobacterium phage Julie1]|uniref:Uncharacterized protein n=2 Tax=Julieunavirus TaxID=2948773 RepID=W8EEQ4_9CAUD|nr:hypothetical protein CG90_gp55 [Mycobacterium phage Julie1]AHJ88555.1 hypothetical protein Jolie1_055 [Mycobacterium phage Julie1]
MTDQPTDLEPVADRRAITFLRSTTTTTVDIQADGDTDTEVKHLARFAVEPGTVPDMQRRYGTWVFRPSWMEALYRDGYLEEVRVTGPRVLKAGLSKTGDSGDFRWERGWRRDDAGKRPVFDYDALPGPLAEAVKLYERRVVVASSSPTAPFL